MDQWLIEKCSSFWSKRMSTILLDNCTSIFEQPAMKCFHLIIGNSEQLLEQLNQMALDNIFYLHLKKQ